jgi:hypothetical protein
MSSGAPSRRDVIRIDSGAVGPEFWVTTQPAGAQDDAVICAGAGSMHDLKASFRDRGVSRT